VVCVAARSVPGRNPFEPLEKEFRVLYGVTRTKSTGQRLKDPYENINQAAFKKALPQRSRPGNSRHEELRLRAGRYTSAHCAWLTRCTAVQLRARRISMSFVVSQV